VGHETDNVIHKLVCCYFTSHKKYSCEKLQRIICLQDSEKTWQTVKKMGTVPTIADPQSRRVV